MTNPTIILVSKELVAWWVKHHSLRLHVLFNRKNNNNTILDFSFSYFSYSFIFFEYSELIVSLRYIFISIFFLLDIFIVLFTFEARSSILSWVFKKSLFRYFDFNFLIIHVVIMDTDRTLIIVGDR